jgi:Icc-related predicted phosphoesterase
MINQVKLPDGDILAIAGDFTWKGTISEIATFAHHLSKLKTKYKDIVVTPGNHDFLCEDNPRLAREMLAEHCHYLIDEEVTVQGLRIHGGPYQPEFHAWAFNLPRGEPLKEKWDLIKPRIDLLLTHSPPYGIGDFTFYDKIHVGCEQLLLAVERVKPRAHFFGHIHEGYGQWDLGGTKFANVSTCTLQYKPTNAPVVIDL